MRHFLLRPTSYQQLTKRTIEVRRLHRELRDSKARFREQAEALKCQAEANQCLQQQVQSYTDIIHRMIDRSHYDAPVAMEAAATLSSPVGADQK